MTGHRDVVERGQRPPWGLRGWQLLVWGSVWLVWGGTLVLAAGERAETPTYAVLVRVLPLEVWGWVWVVTGLLGAAAGMVRRHAAGFVLLALLPVGWGIGLAASAITADSITGLPLGWTFIGIGVAVALTARMEDARLVLERLQALRGAPPGRGEGDDGDAS